MDYNLGSDSYFNQSEVNHYTKALEDFLTFIKDIYLNLNMIDDKRKIVDKLIIKVYQKYNYLIFRNGLELIETMFSNKDEKFIEKIEYYYKYRLFFMLIDYYDFYKYRRKLISKPKKEFQKILVERVESNDYVELMIENKIVEKTRCKNKSDYSIECFLQNYRKKDSVRLKIKKVIRMKKKKK